MRIIRLQLLVFLVLAGAFLFAGLLVERGGRWLSERLYAPLLSESTAADLAAGKYGVVEHDLLAVLKASPAYAPAILDLTAPSLRAMPELAHRLLGCFEDSDDPRGGSLLNALRVHLARDDLDGLAEDAIVDGSDPLIIWQERALYSAGLRAFGLWTGPDAVLPPCPEGADDEEALAPEFAARKAPLYAWLGIHPDSAYARGIAAFESGRWADARPEFARALESGECPADTAFHLGVMAESAGETEGALESYAEALALGRVHLAAAEGYLRLTAEEAGPPIAAPVEAPPARSPAESDRPTDR